MPSAPLRESSGEWDDGAVHYGFVQCAGKKDEDRFSCTVKTGDEIGLFSIFDGHGGADAAQAAADLLHESWGARLRTEKSDGGDLNWREDAADAATRSFGEVHEKILGQKNHFSGTSVTSFAVKRRPKSGGSAGGPSEGMCVWVGDSLAVAYHLNEKHEENGASQSAEAPSCSSFSGCSAEDGSSLPPPDAEDVPSPVRPAVPPTPPTPAHKPSSIFQSLRRRTSDVKKAAALSLPVAFRSDGERPRARSESLVSPHTPERKDERDRIEGCWRGDTEPFAADGDANLRAMTITDVCIQNGRRKRASSAPGALEVTGDKGRDVGKAAGLPHEKPVVMTYWSGGACPSLQMTRSLGDRDATSAITATPEWRRVDREEGGAEVRVVLATDGLWDVVQPEQIQKIVCALPAGRALEAARRLAVAAQRRWAELGRRQDDVTVCVIDLIEPVPQLTLPQIDRAAAAAEGADKVKEGGMSSFKSLIFGSAKRGKNHSTGLDSSIHKDRPVKRPGSDRDPSLPDPTESVKLVHVPMQHVG